MNKQKLIEQLKPIIDATDKNENSAEVQLASGVLCVLVGALLDGSIRDLSDSTAAFAAGRIEKERRP